MTEELRRRKDEEHKILEVFDRELDSMEKNQIEMKNKITEMKNKLVENERSSNDAEEQFINWGKKKISGNHWSWADKRKKTKKKRRQFKRSLWQNQAYDICIIEVPEGKERWKGKNYIWRQRS